MTEAEGNWTLTEVTDAERDLFHRLFELYLYDFSEMEHADIGEDGLFQPPAVPWLARFWTSPESHALLLRVAGKPAGFTLVDERSPIPGSADRRYIAGFFMMRTYRRRGFARLMAHETLRRYPGAWQVLEVANNPIAQTFWRQEIGRATGGRFTERWLNEREVVQEFEIAATTS